LVAIFLAAERITLKQSALLLAVFLAGRLLGYIGWAVVAWLLGQTIFRNPGGPIFFAVADLALGGWLVYYGLSRPLGHSREVCPASRLNAWRSEGVV
jgi:hypothetical protein